MEIPIPGKTGLVSLTARARYELSLVLWLQNLIYFMIYISYFSHFFLYWLTLQFLKKPWKIWIIAYPLEMFVSYFFIHHTMVHMDLENIIGHDDVIKWKLFTFTALMFSLICVWINSWVNNRKAGDLRRYRAHYDVIVMMGVTNPCCNALFLHVKPYKCTGPCRHYGVFHYT